MNAGRMPETVRAHKRVLGFGMSVCLAMGLLAGCASAAETKPSSAGSFLGCTLLSDNEWSEPPPPTQTGDTIVDVWSPYDTLESLIEGSTVVIAGCVKNWRYETTSNGLDVETILIVEVMGVFAGALQPGDKIEVYQFGGVTDGTLRRDEKFPYLTDHRGEDLVLFLRQRDTTPESRSAYWVADSFHGAWTNDSGRLSVLLGAERGYLPPGYPETMTTAELEEAVRRAK